MIRKTTLLALKLLERNITPERLSEATGVPVASIYAAKRGASRFERTPKHLDALNKFFGTVNDQLLEFQEPFQPTEVRASTLREGQSALEILENSNTEDELRNKIKSLLDSKSLQSLAMARIHLDALERKMSKTPTREITSNSRNR